MRSVAFDVRERVQKHLIPVEFSGANHRADAQEFLIDDASRADVLMPHLAVADDSRWQADFFAGGMDKRMRIRLPQPVIYRRFGEVDSVRVVTLRIRIMSPSISDDEDDRTFL